MTLLNLLADKVPVLKAVNITDVSSYSTPMCFFLIFSHSTFSRIFSYQSLKVATRPWSGLQKTRKHDESLLLVLVAKLLSVRTLLALGPREHLESAYRDEESHRPVTARDNDANPGQHLEHVVRAGHQGEGEADGDLALRAACGTQARQVQVDRGVAKLAKQVDQGPDEIDDGLVCRGGEGGGAVDEVGAHQSRDGPVEEAVLEDVVGGHGVGGELVHEECLEFTLDEV